MSIRLISTIICIAILICFTGYSKERTWKNKQGDKIKAELVRYDGKNVKLKRNEKINEYSYDDFCEADRDYLDKWYEEHLRTWQNTNGKELKAILVDFNGKTVKLGREGKIRSFSAEQLCEADKEYLEEWYDEKMSVPTGRIKGKKFTEEFSDYWTTKDQKSAKEFYSENKAVDHEVDQDQFDLEKMTQITENDSFTLYVPQHCKKNIPFGLYIHISPGNNSMIPGGYEKIFDEANIICASPKGAGNKKHDFRRIVLALSCVAAVRDEYTIDENRIYVGGLSGGGIISFLAHFLYPEVFKGAISHARGVGLERTDIPDEKRYYTKSVDFLSEKRLKSIADNGHRWVFLSGEEDFNYQHINLVLPKWKEFGFDVKFIDVDGMGHENAPPEAFKKSLRWIDNYN